MIVAISLVLGALLPFTSATLRNITITDQSPTIFYSPPQSGIDNEPWNVTYTGSTWTNYSGGAVGNGESAHFSRTPGTSASFGFKGTAVYVSGSANGADVHVTIGDQQADTGGNEGFLGWKKGLEDKWWTVRVNVTGSGGVKLTGITFTVDIGGQGANLSTASISALSGSQNGPNPDFSFSGSWSSRTVAGPANQVYPRIDTSAANARSVFPTFESETFVMVYGTTNYDHGAYRIDCTDPAQGWPEWSIPSGRSPWFAFDEVLWFGLVDGGSVSAQNMDEGRWLDLARIDVITATGGQPRPGTGGGGNEGNGNGSNGNGGGDDGGTDIGLIVGATIGGLAGLALLALLGLFLWRRKKRHEPDYYQAHMVTTTPPEIDPYRETTAMTPPSGVQRPSDGLYHATDAGSGSSGSQYGVLPFPLAHSHSHDSASSPFPQPGMPPSSHSEGSSGQPSPNPLMLVSSSDNLAPPILPTAAKSPRRQSHSTVRQETDAGSVSVIPPSYDPAWAQAQAQGNDSVLPPGAAPSEDSQSQGQLEMRDRSPSAPSFGKR